MFDAKPFELRPESLATAYNSVGRDVWMKDKKCFINDCGFDSYAVMLE
jgi:hypothetical protein